MKNGRHQTTIYSLLTLTAALASFQLPSRLNLSSGYPVYAGNDLGVSYSPAKTMFKIWAPNASGVKIKLYAKGAGDGPIDAFDMTLSSEGVWQYTAVKDLKNKFYTIQVTQDGQVLSERPDLYAKAVGVNGARGMIVDLAATNPPNWTADRRPALQNFNDIVLYEIHLRDISMDPESGITNKGKYLGLAEVHTKSADGEVTGLEHIKSLGVTHVHLLPAFDFNSIDETHPDKKQYNWGYDPLNYNVPEGSYSADPYNGNVRIKEFKQMIQSLHANGLRVILDVVYNHTSSLEASFNQFVPGYFYRHKEDGSYSDATGCGNETASEQEMMRRYMISSVLYWVKEYHLDGFRFDLMGVHDLETMNQISAAVHQIDPTIFLYGEGWTAGGSPYPEDLRAVKKNAAKLINVSVFNDDLRDGIKGSYSDAKSKGFVSGATGNADNVKFGIVGSVQHSQVNYANVSYSKAAWAKEPYQSINYVSCHDDNTLFDKLKIANPDATEAELIKMDKLSNAIVLTSQGVPFLHGGVEFLRTKKGISNSYKSPDSINQIEWSRKTKYKSVFTYYKSLIALRKEHPAFRMTSADMVRAHLSFSDTKDELLISYQLSDHANGDKWKNIFVVFNAHANAKTVLLPEGKWHLAMDGAQRHSNATSALAGEVKITGISAYVFYQE